jgi:DNA-binding NarL/FixJ family response regulator
MSIDHLVRRRNRLIALLAALPQKIEEIEREINTSVMPRVTVTDRQRQVLERIRMPNKVIAIELGIAERTVKFHVGRMLKKFNLTNRRELGG